MVFKADFFTIDHTIYFYAIIFRCKNCYSGDVVVTDNIFNTTDSKINKIHTKIAKEKEDHRFNCNTCHNCNYYHLFTWNILNK